MTPTQCMPLPTFRTIAHNGPQLVNTCASLFSPLKSSEETIGGKLIFLSTQLENTTKTQTQAIFPHKALQSA